MFLGLTRLTVTIMCDLIIAVGAEVARDTMIVGEIPPLALIPRGAVTR
jgi:hypothetical protein